MQASRHIHPTWQGLQQAKTYQVCVDNQMTDDAPLSQVVQRCAAWQEPLVSALRDAGSRVCAACQHVNTSCTPLWQGKRPRGMGQNPPAQPTGLAKAHGTSFCRTSRVRSLGMLGCAPMPLNSVHSVGMHGFLARQTLRPCAHAFFSFASCGFLQKRPCARGRTRPHQRKAVDVENHAAHLRTAPANRGPSHVQARAPVAWCTAQCSPSTFQGTSAGNHSAVRGWRSRAARNSPHASILTLPHRFLRPVMEGAMQQSSTGTSACVHFACWLSGRVEPGVAPPPRRC